MAKDEAYRKAEERIAEARRTGARTIVLSGLGLTELPVSLWQLTQLQQLRVDNNQLTALPAALGQLTQLRTLAVWRNQLTVLPEALGQLTQLNQLDLSGNQLTALPEALGQLTQLLTLDVSSNQLTALPEALGQLTQLQTLNVAGNQLTALPEALGQLTQLQSLSAWSNQLTALPEALGQLTQLNQLDLSGNQLTALPTALGQLTQLQTLFVSSNQLTALPEALGQLTQLQTLNVGGNPLTALPEALGQLTQLQSLSAWSNQLTALPEALGQLTQLNQLDLSGNQLTALPEALGQLTQLQKLDVSRNQLTALPTALGQLTQLHQLDLTRNQLTALPETLGQLTQLQELRVSGNQLTALPTALGQLTLLRRLHVWNNQLRALPAALGGLEKLEELYLHGNPGLGLPEEVLGPTWEDVARRSKPAKPAREILDYYFRIHPPGAAVAGRGGRPILEARIIVIGDGASGKTSLVRQLLHGLPAQKDEASTRDVFIALWPVELRANHVQVNLWDFGGQRQMHAAHPYFFTTRTLYLVVAEARKDQQDRVEYWLKMVAKYGDAARAVVVVNKCEDHAMSLDRPKLLDRYRKNLPPDASQAFFATSCKTGEGIAVVRQALHRELEKMEQVWALWPEEWFRVKEALLNLRQPKGACPAWLQPMVRFFAGPRADGNEGPETLNFETWRAICSECGVATEKDRDDLLEHLGHLGRVVCFPRDPQLRALGVLNPEWVTRGIYPLLVETKFAAQGGMLTLEDLEHLLPHDRYPKERHGWLVGLMKAFELVFEDDRHRLLLPGQLPADSPPWAQPQEWSDPETLHLELRYDAVLPESVISQFIVRRHREARRPGEWWRHGIALQRGACEALVRAHVTEQEAKIELRLRGPREERRDLLSSIRESLRDPKDTTPPDLFVILGKDCAVKYSELLIHAGAGKRELDFIIEGKSVTRQLAPILDMIEAPAQQAASREAVNVQVNVRNENKPDMSRNYGDITNSPGAAMGENNTLTFTNCFNTAALVQHPPLKEALTALVEAVQKLHPSLSEAEKGTAERRLKALTEEAAQPKPDKGLLAVTAKGLVEAAETCAKLAGPVVAATKTVLGLFGVTLP
jgi:internalin A